MLNNRHICIILTALVIFTTGAVFAVPPPEKGKWMKITSANYTLFTNRSGRGAQTMILQDLEEVRSCFISCIPELSVPSGSAKGIVRVFRTRKNYLDAVGENFKWSGGLWNGKELLISPPENEKYARGARLTIKRVMFHEGFHQYLASVLPGIYVDMWFNEGCAQFFENTDARKRVKLNENMEKHIASVVAKYPFTVKQLMSLSYKDFYNEQTRNANYAAAFSFVYYLLKGAKADNLPAADIPAFYISQLKKSRNHKTAFNAVARKFDLKSVDADWRKFWSSPKRLRKAARYMPK